jgi:hypothetical protein
MRIPSGPNPYNQMDLTLAISFINVNLCIRPGIYSKQGILPAKQHPGQSDSGFIHREQADDERYRRISPSCSPRSIGVFVGKAPQHGH